MPVHPPPTLRRLVRDERAVSATEFALLLPLMLLLLVAVVDLADVLILDRKLAAATRTVSDIAAREATLSPSGLADIQRGAEIVFQPFRKEPLNIAVAAVEWPNTPTSTAQCRWVWKTAGGSFPINPRVLAADLAEKGNGVVVVRVTYDFVPKFTGFVTGAVRLEETAFAVPRKSPTVGCPSCSTTCP